MGPGLAVAIPEKMLIPMSPAQKKPPRRAVSAPASAGIIRHWRWLLLDEQLVKGLFIVLIIEAELLIVDVGRFTGIVHVLDFRDYEPGEINRRVRLRIVIATTRTIEAARHQHSCHQWQCNLKKTSHTDLLLVW
jgi:hypothetical protein